MSLAALRRGGAALVAGLLVAGSLGWPPSAVAAAPRPAAACTGATGITVVVDFGELAGGVQHRCVTQAVTSGLDALRKAGFAVETTVRFPGLLCRIDGRPADEGCVNAPPADRYWSYWTAPALGGAWTYSDQGGGNRVPPQGSVEGWAFSDGCDRKPGGTCSTPGPTTTTTTPRPTTTTTPVDRPGGAAATTPSTARGDGPEDASTSTTAPATADGSTTTVASDDRAPVAGEPGDEDALGAQPAAAVSSDGGDGESGGSALGVLAVAAVVLALVAAATLTARRRRTDGTGP